jgi:hypothetical protein
MRQTRLVEYEEFAGVHTGGQIVKREKSVNKYLDKDFGTTAL